MASDKPNKNGQIPYLVSIAKLSDNFFDFILVDGKFRAECSLLAVRKLKKNGILVLDDSHRYISSEPSYSKTFKIISVH